MKAETSKFNKVEIVHVLRADPNLSKNPKKLKDYLLQNNTKNDGSKMPKYSIKSQLYDNAKTSVILILNSPRT